MKTEKEIRAKLDEAIAELDNIPSWETEDTASVSGVIAALGWVLGEVDGLDTDEQ